MAAGAFITVPFGPVPFTLQTLMLGIVICLLPSAWPVAAVGGYLALGCLGLPVFSGMRGGIAVLAGPTGGFLVGFLVATVVIALIRSKALRPRSTATGNAAAAAAPAPAPAFSRPRLRQHMIVMDVASLVLLSLIYYILGCLWFMVSTGTTLEAALAASVLPFILPDILKAIAAFICIQPVRAALGLGVAAA